MFTRIILAFLFSVSSFALGYELEQDGNEITVAAGYSDNSSIQVTATCFEENEGLFESGWDIGIKLSPPIDMRRTDNQYYLVLFGGYESCNRESWEYSGRYCENLHSDIDFGETQIDFLDHDATIEIQRVLHSNCLRPGGFVDNRATLDQLFAPPKPECGTTTIARYNFDWFREAKGHMSRHCRTIQEKHQDKISSHIKRILNW